MWYLQITLGVQRLPREENADRLYIVLDYESRIYMEYMICFGLSACSSACVLRVPSGSLVSICETSYQGRALLYAIGPSFTHHVFLFSRPSWCLKFTFLYTVDQDTKRVHYQ